LASIKPAATTITLNFMSLFCIDYSSAYLCNATGQTVLMVCLSTTLTPLAGHCVK
jgi:hypothetical protein